MALSAGFGSNTGVRTSPNSGRFVQRGKLAACDPTRTLVKPVRCSAATWLVVRAHAIGTSFSSFGQHGFRYTATAVVSTAVELKKNVPLA